jgi:hypothetical protein
MKVFVFTYDRYDSITTSAMLEAEGIDHVVLCHSIEAREAFREGGLVLPQRIMATEAPKGLAYNRNVALDLMDMDEWAVFLVDDLKTITELRNYDTAVDPLPMTMANQTAYRKRFQTPISMTQFMQRADQLVAHCERKGAKLGGWCGIANPIYRKGHWGYNVLADGRAWVVKKSALRFDENVQMIDDLCWTALNIMHFGTVVIDRWLLPDCKRYTAGAFGSIEDRIEQKLHEAAYLVSTYPDLIAYKAKTGWVPGSHVVLKPQRR